MKLNCATFGIIVYINANMEKLIKIRFCNFKHQRLIPPRKIEISISSSRVPIC